MNWKNYRKAVQIGNCVTDIINMPCVDSVRKSFEGKLFYSVNTGTPEGTSTEIAQKGDWLCEDYDGNWHVEKNREQQ